MRNFYINGKGNLITAPIGTFESYESIADLFSDLRADFPKLKAIARQEINQRKKFYRKNEPAGGYDISDTDELELSDRDSLIISKKEALEDIYDSNDFFRKTFLYRHFYLDVDGCSLEFYLGWMDDISPDRRDISVPVLFTSYLEKDLFILYYEMKKDFELREDGVGSIQLILGPGCFYGYSLDGCYLFYAADWT